MKKESIYIIRCRQKSLGTAALCLLLAACSPNEGTDIPATATDALVATAALPAASGSVTGGNTRALTDGSGLSALTLWYPAASAGDANHSTDIGAPTAYLVPADFITQTESSLSFVTAKTADSGAKPADGALYWPQINGQGKEPKTFYLTLKRAETYDDGNGNTNLPVQAKTSNGSNDISSTTLWGKCQTEEVSGASESYLYRSPLAFGTLKNRFARLTVVVKPGGGRADLTHFTYIKIGLNAVPGATEDVATDATHLASLPWPRAKKQDTDEDMDAAAQPYIYGSSSSPITARELTASLYLAPQAVPTGNGKNLLSITYTYRGVKKTVTQDLSTLKVTRTASSEFFSGNTDPANGIYATGTAFGYNANEHLRLTLSLVVNDALTPGTVTVEDLKDATDAGNGQEWDQDDLGYTIETDAATGQKTYVVTSAKGLQYFANLVNNATTSKGRALNCRLEKDIALPASSNPNTKSNWTPIGIDYSKSYTGTFDGNGHTVSGLFVSQGTDYQGFFGHIGSATVKNLTVEGKVRGRNYTGGIVGYSYSGSRVEGCTSRVEVNGGEQVGGIVGETYNSTITACINTGSVTGTDYYCSTGGVVGHSYYYSTITACINTGSVTSTGYTNKTGGVVGEHYYYSTITACINTGSVTSTDSIRKIGGVAGHNFFEATITACYWQSFGTSGNRPTAGIGDGNGNTVQISDAYTDVDTPSWLASDGSSGPIDKLNATIGTWNNDHANDGKSCPYDFYANPDYTAALAAATNKDYDTPVPPLLLKKTETTPTPP